MSSETPSPADPGPDLDGRWVAFVAVAGGVLSLWLLVLVVIHAGRPVHDLPAGAVVMGVAGALGSAAGWALIARSNDPMLLAAAFLALLLVGGVVSLLSVGALLLLIGCGVAVVLGRVAGRRRAEGRPIDARQAVVAAGLVGFGLPISALVAADGPVVRCLVDGVSTSSSIFRSSSSSSSTGTSMSSGGVSTGEIVQGGRAYRYRCAGGELVEFDASDA